MKKQMQPLNILILTYQGNTAGSTNSIAYLSKGLADKGHNVYVGCRKESLLYALLSNTRVHRVAMTFKSKTDLQNMRQIRDVVRTHDIRIINAQSSWDRYTSILASWIYRLNVKIIHTRRQKPESVGGLLQKWFYVAGTEKIVVISDELKQMFIRKRFPEKHIHVIYNGIPKERFDSLDLSHVEELRKKFNLSGSDVVIGCVSRLKNQEQIVKALRYLDPGYKVLFVGITPGLFDDLAKEIGVANQILYSGVVVGDEVLNYYKLMDVNILASTMDGFGLVLIEAMALGVPVVATNFGGIKNVVQDGYNGLLFDDNDIQGLAARVKKAICDAQLRQRLIDNGKKTAFETFTMEKTVDNYEKFYYSLLSV